MLKFAWIKSRLAQAAKAIQMFDHRRIKRVDAIYAILYP